MIGFGCRITVNDDSFTVAMKAFRPDSPRCPTFLTSSRASAVFARFIETPLKPVDKMPPVSAIGKLADAASGTRPASLFDRFPPVTTGTLHIKWLLKQGGILYQRLYPCVVKFDLPA